MLFIIFHFTHAFHTIFVHYFIYFKLDIHFEIVMFIWWQRIWNTDLQRLQHHHQQQNKQISIINVPTQRQSHIANCRETSTHTSHQMPYSIHNCHTRQSKCIRMSSNEHATTRMRSFCSVIILIHCFNVFVLAIASENSTTTQPQPCDRTRRVFTDVQGEISNGPFGSNYTQVSTFFYFVSFFISFHLIPNVHFVVVVMTLRVWACVFLVELISYSNVLSVLFIFSLQKRDEKKKKQNNKKLLNVLRLNHVN